MGGEVVSGTKPVFDADYESEDTFVDVVGVKQREEGAGSERFILADALMRANLLSETVLAGDVGSSEPALCNSSFCILVSFFYRNNKMAIHFFLKLVTRAHLNMKMASWGFCVLLFDSSEEPVAHLRDAFGVVPGLFGNEFEVGCVTSCDEVPSLGKSPPMGCATSV